MKLQIETFQDLDETLRNEISNLLSDETPMQFCSELNYYKQMPAWFVIREHELCALLGIFAPGKQEAEIMVEVDKKWRQQGLYTKLLLASLETIKKYGYTKALLVVNARDKNSGACAARAICEQKSYTLTRQEYTLRRHVDTTNTHSKQTEHREHQELQFSKAKNKDNEHIARCLSLAFGDREEDTRELAAAFLADPKREVWLVWQNQICVGTGSIYHGPDFTSINALAIIPDFQGRGLGRSLLQHLCTQARTDHAIELDVDCTNPRALKLYEDCGFHITKQINYFKVPL